MAQQVSRTDMMKRLKPWGVWGYPSAYMQIGVQADVRPWIHADVLGNLVPGTPDVPMS